MLISILYGEPGEWVMRLFLTQKIRGALLEIWEGVGAKLPDLLIVDELAFPPKSFLFAVALGSGGCDAKR